MPLAAVGSTNPVKIGAVTRIFGFNFPDVRVVGVDVASGVSAQPIGEEETALGAKNRALAAMAATGADWGIGLEGGVTFRGDECWMNGFCAIIHEDGRVSFGRGAEFLLPPALGGAVRSGGEVGPLMDQLTGLHETKKKGGAIGFLTNGAVVREDLFAAMVAAALVSFLHPELYKA